ncbi:MAG: hypothetical protein CM15mV26_0140 [uncultured marine virus]|nr:MAG: hypothetical protein CM15mV26_0140 [uncultured marine virus]
MMQRLLLQFLFQLILLRLDEDEIMIPPKSSCNLVEPVESVVKMYLEKMSYGQNDQSDPYRLTVKG